MPRNRESKVLSQSRIARQRPSVAEQIMWKLLRNNAIGFKFRREHGLESYRLDFYCHEAKLAVEMDGEQHDPAADAARDLRLSSVHGILVYRVPNRRFFMLDEDLYRDEIEPIRKLCEERSGRKAFPSYKAPEK